MEDWNWETIFYGHYRPIFTRCDIIGLKIYRIRRKKTQNKGYYGIQGHSRYIHTGAEAEMPKASRWVGRRLLETWAESWAIQWGPRRSPGRKRISVLSKRHRMPVVGTFIVNWDPVRRLLSCIMHAIHAFGRLGEGASLLALSLDPSLWLRWWYTVSGIVSLSRCMASTGTSLLVPFYYDVKRGILVLASQTCPPP